LYLIVLGIHTSSLHVWDPQNEDFEQIRFTSDTITLTSRVGMVVCVCIMNQIFNSLSAEAGSVQLLNQKAIIKLNVEAISGAIQPHIGMGFVCPSICSLFFWVRGNPNFVHLYLKGGLSSRAVPNILFVFYSGRIVSRIVYSYSAE